MTAVDWLISLLTRYDRRTDRQTDGKNGDDNIYRASIASRGNKNKYNMTKENFHNTKWNND